jgi:hypothetical protein
MTTRREWLLGVAGAGGLLALDPRLALASEAKLITRAIPRTGERLPLVGLGSSATFAQVARSEDITALRAVLGKMVELGGTVFDTAPPTAPPKRWPGGSRRNWGSRRSCSGRRS